MFFFFAAGNRFKTSHEGTTDQVIRCPNCGKSTRFERKSGRQYLTLFFVLPVLPLGGKHSFVECPNCRARFDVAPDQRMAA